MESEKPIESVRLAAERGLQQFVLLNRVGPNLIHAASIWQHAFGFSAYFDPSGARCERDRNSCHFTGQLEKCCDWQAWGLV